jgi:hypothetical protein
MQEMILKQLYEALGWQGGTIHQVIAEIKRLKSLPDHEGWCNHFLGGACNCNKDKKQSETLKLASVVKRIGYPERGTKDEYASLQDFADEIQKEWTLELLEKIAST